MKRPRGLAMAWTRAALAELEAAINGERDPARWLRMSRALSRVREAIADVDTITEAATQVADERANIFRANRSKRWHERGQMRLPL